MTSEAFPMETEKIERYQNVLEQAERVAKNRSAELDQQEEENDQKKRKACGIFHSVDIVFDGTHEMIVFLCRDYRLCENCRKQKWLKELAPVLSYGHNHLPLGEWLKRREVHDNDLEAYMKAIKRYGGQYKNIPQPNHMNLLIHNAEGFGDPELYDFDEYEGQDVNFKEVLANVPKGRRISGKLGKKGIIEKDEEGEGEIDENDKYEDVRVPHLHSPSATVRDVNIAYMKAVKDTQNISVKDQHELSQAMFTRLEAMKKYLPEDAFIFYDVKSVGLKQSQQWNENPNNGVVVHLTTIEVVHSNKTDKYTLSGVGKFFREIGMLDDLPFETAYDLV